MKNFSKVVTTVEFKKQSEVFQCPVCGVLPNGSRGMGEYQVMTCQACSLVYCSQPDSGAPSAGNSSTATAPEYTERMLEPTPTAIDRGRQLAKNRLTEYSKRLGRVPRILEVGCGSGLIGRGYVSNGAEYTGLDIDRRVVEVAKGSGLDVRGEDFLSFSDARTFDVIAASQVLEHITAPQQFVEQAKRLLAADGLLHVDVPNHFALAGIPSRLVPKLFKARYGGITPPHHCISYTSDALRTLLQDSGFAEPDVFDAVSSDLLWGQAGVVLNGAAGMYFKGSAMMRRGNLLVALSRPTRTAV
jgi:SAM-dependent methyltransferase